MERDFKGIWIPKEVWLDDRLTALDKIILMEINSLDNDEGCFASNGYLAEFCQCSEAKVTKAIAKLREFGYLYIKKFDGRKRFLGSCLVKSTRQTSKKYEADWEKVRHNNIYNNINNNKRKKEETFDDIFIKKKVSPELKDAFIELIKMRKLNKKKMTNRALELAIDKVRNMEEDENYQIEIINQSVANGWQGLFPLKDKKERELICQNNEYVIKDGEDITWKRLFKFWAKVLGYNEPMTNKSVAAAKKLLEIDGEEGSQKLIVALRMRERHRYLNSEVKNVSSFEDLLAHRRAIWGFYNSHQNDWNDQMRQSSEGKELWRM